MKVVLDEDTTVPLEEWAGVKNGQLLALIRDAGFNVLITCDQNLEHQQNLISCSFGIVVLQVRTKKIDYLLPLVPDLLVLLPTVQAGRVYHVAEPPRSR